MKLCAHLVHRKPCPKPASWLRMGSTCSTRTMPVGEELMHAPLADLGGYVCVVACWLKPLAVVQ